MNASVSRVLAAVLVASVAVTTPGCADTPSNDRWVTTENAAVEIDWDAIATAYREADGPEDFERRVNEIYMGDEIVSVAVRDLDASAQEVSGFFDRDHDGEVGEGERIFKIRRDIAGDQAHVRVDGHGPYYGYHSPLLTVAAGMWMGSMMARAFTPGYVPMYRQPYVTSAARRGQLTTARNNYRRANPGKVQNAKRSRAGRQYGNRGGAFGGGRQAPSRTRIARPRGGARFGLRRGPNRKVVRL